MLLELFSSHLLENRSDGFVIHSLLLARCGNINWAKRTKCNICNTTKPGHNEGGVRYGLFFP